MEDRLTQSIASSQASRQPPRFIYRAVDSCEEATYPFRRCTDRRPYGPVRTPFDTGLTQILSTHHHQVDMQIRIRPSAAAAQFRDATAEFYQPDQNITLVIDLHV